MGVRPADHRLHQAAAVEPPFAEAPGEHRHGAAPADAGESVSKRQAVGKLLGRGQGQNLQPLLAPHLAARDHQQPLSTGGARHE